MILRFLLVGAAFALGSIPFGVLLARRRGISIQDHGSGNIGATNVARVLGLKAGAIVLALDAAKGALPVVLARIACGEPWTVALAAFAAIAGHCFSPWLGGRGGKGVATAFGVFLVLSPWSACVAVAAFAIALRFTRVPALGSLAGVLAIAAYQVSRGEAPYAVLACATAVLLVYTHRSNLAKLRGR